MQRLQRLSVGSFAKFCGLCGVVYGLVAAGIVYVVGSIAFLGNILGAGPFEQGLGHLTPLFGGLVLLLPICHGVSALVGGALFAWLYNVYARRCGGIEVEWESVASQPDDRVAS